MTKSKTEWLKFPKKMMKLQKLKKPRFDLSLLLRISPSISTLTKMTSREESWNVLIYQKINFMTKSKTIPISTPPSGSLRVSYSAFSPSPTSLTTLWTIMLLLDSRLVSYTVICSWFPLSCILWWRSRTQSRILFNLWCCSAMVSFSTSRVAFCVLYQSGLCKLFFWCLPSEPLHTSFTKICPKSPILTKKAAFWSRLVSALAFSSCSLSLWNSSFISN